MSTLTYRGRPCCTCQAAWFPAFEKELRARGLITDSLRIAQLIGGAEASKGAHLGGGAADWWETSEDIAKVARMMGAPATWPRVTGSFATNRHTHSVLRGCPHVSDLAASQIREVDLGGDGLLGDIADPLELRMVLNRRTWRQGIEWHRQQELRRKRIAKIEATRARKAKWQGWVTKANANIARLKALV